VLCLRRFSTIYCAEFRKAPNSACSLVCHGLQADRAAANSHLVGVETLLLV
jgi:hypothetical protein